LTRFGSFPEEDPKDLYVSMIKSERQAFDETKLAGRDCSYLEEVIAAYTPTLEKRHT